MVFHGQPGRVLVGRLAHGADLLAELNRISAEAGVRAGRVEAIGAVSRARFGYYDQKRREYGYIECQEPLEILALVGNVSLKDGQVFVHAHVTLADEAGRAFGGHLAEGTTVFAAEYRIEELTGIALHRTPDAATGLTTWE
jgi:hypothetical protein